MSVSQLGQWVLRKRESHGLLPSYGTIKSNNSNKNPSRKDIKFIKSNVFKFQEGRKEREMCWQLLGSPLMRVVVLEM